MSKLVEQSSDVDLSEERRKSETDLAATQGLPSVKPTINTNDLRYVEREVCDHPNMNGVADVHDHCTFRSPANPTVWAMHMP